MQEYNKQTTAYLSRAEDDLPDHAAARPSANNASDKRESGSAPVKQDGKKKSFKLEEVDRWTMVKRIW